MSEQPVTKCSNCGSTKFDLMNERFADWWDEGGNPCAQQIQSTLQCRDCHEVWTVYSPSGADLRAEGCFPDENTYR